METDPVSVRRTDPAGAADEGYPLAGYKEPAPASGEPSEEERSRFLAAHAAEALLEAGLTERRIEELAREFAAGSNQGGLDEFVAWARTRA